METGEIMVDSGIPACHDWTTPSWRFPVVSAYNYRLQGPLEFLRLEISYDEFLLAANMRQRIDLEEEYFYGVR